MADRYEIAARHANQVSAVILGVCVVLNVAFYFLSSAYFDDRTAMHGFTAPNEIAAVRVAFGIFSGVTGLFAMLAIRAPRLVGHGLAAAAGVLSLIGAIAAYKTDIHIVLPVALVVVAGLLAALVVRSLSRSRAAWAFLAAMCSVLSAVTLFGATKVRNELEIGLWFALILPGLLAVASAALSMVRVEYRDPV